MASDVLTKSEFRDLRLLKRGKVRDVYDLGDRLLIISTDRISAFDVILPDPIPDKGRVLNGLSLFWMDRTRTVVPNHFITADPNEYPQSCRPFSDML